MLEKHKKKRPRTQVPRECKRSRIASTQYPQIRKLEKKLRESKTPLSDAEFKELHASFTDEYESLIITDYPSTGVDLERALWNAHHLKIAEFRSQLQKQKKTTVSKRNHQRFVAPLIEFVASSSKFYITLVSKLRVKYGLTETSSGLDGWESEQGQMDEMQICYVTCHQLLMRLGDLARYKEVYGVSLENRDYSTAERYYRQASRLCYCDGSPHNQLAVLATHVRDNIRAAYHYLRCEFAKVSQPLSHDNLVILLSSKEEKSLADPKFSVHFLKVAGILLIRTDSKDLQDELGSALKEFQKQLACGGPEADEGAERKSRAVLGIQMVVTLMSGVIYNMSKPETFLLEAFMAASKFVQLLISLTIDDPMRTMLPAVVTFFIWLANHADIVKATSETAELRRSFLDVLRHAENLFLAISLPPENESVPKSSDSDELIESRNDIALWEDRELQGFSPLDAHFDKLNFKAAQSDDKRANGIRIQRLAASLNTITLVAGLSEHLIGLSSHRETVATPEQNLVSDSQYLGSSQKLNRGVQQPSSLTLSAELSKDLNGLSFMESLSPMHSPVSSTVPSNIGGRSLPYCLTNYEDKLVPENTSAKPQTDHSMQEQVPDVDDQFLKGSLKALQTAPDFQMHNSKQPVEQPQQSYPSLSRKILRCSQPQQGKRPCPGELIQGRVQCGSASVNLDDESWFDSLTHIKPAALTCDPRLQSTSVCGLKNLERYQTRNPFVVLRLKSELPE